MLLSLGLVLSLAAHAEYRVYQYLVRPRGSGVQSEARAVRSTYPPVSFLAYHGGALALDLTLLRTWMCPGHTGRRDICPSPAERP